MPDDFHPRPSAASQRQSRARLRRSRRRQHDRPPRVSQSSSSSPRPPHLRAVTPPNSDTRRLSARRPNYRSSSPSLAKHDSALTRRDSASARRYSSSRASSSRTSSATTALTPSHSQSRFPSRSMEPSFMGPQPYHASAAVVRSRLVMVWGLLIVGMVGLLGNLVRLQVFQANELRQKAQEQHGISLKPFIPRRPIVDRQGNVIAVDQQEYILYAHPMLFEDKTQAYKSKIAEALAPVLDQDPVTILDRLNLRDSGIKLKSGLSEEDARQVRALKMDGLDLNPYQDRFYPKKNLFSHILGYVNLDREGQVGVEYSQTDLLSRNVPELNLNRTGDGRLMPNGVPTDFNYHEHLRLKLTVDSRLQIRIRNLLHAEIQRLTAERGLAIVMEVDSGAIRAMVTEPTYDPNALHTKDDIPRMVNSAVSHLYEPGSTFKPINMAIALESGRLKSTDVVHDYGKLAFDTWSIENHDFEEEGARGDLTVSDVLKHSSNIGMIQIMKKLDRAQYYDWLESLGLGRRTGIDLPFEAIGLVKQRDRFIETPVESATTSFGQGFSLTPLKLLQMLASLGNEGKLVTPYVVDGLFDHEDRQYWTPERPEPEVVFSEETTRTVLSMMETVVKDGTGKAAQVPGYRIAGKTGTAQKAGDRGVYEENVKVTSFVSLFPAADPQFALLVLIDEPQGQNTYGGTVAAPIAHEIIESIITLENIPPSEDLPR